MSRRTSIIWTIALSASLALAGCGEDEGTSTGNGDDEDAGDTGTPMDTVGDSSDGEDKTGDDTAGDDTIEDTIADAGDTKPPQDTNQDTTLDGDTGDDSDTVERPDYEVVSCTNVSADQTVEVEDFQFIPNEVTVNVGQVVRWDWKDDNHTVTSGGNCLSDDNFDSDFQDSGYSYCVRFNTDGTVPYHCKPHCTGKNMKGTVIVNQ